MKLYEVPLPLKSDAYTLGSRNFESPDARDYSEYYLTFRKFPFFNEPELFNNQVYNESRMIFSGISTAINELFTNQVTHEDIDESIRFLKDRQYLTNGLKDFDFPEYEWRRIVNEFNGYVPLKIEAMPEGSIVYPNEPIVRVSNTVPGFGQFAAYFEAIILNYCWSQSLRATMNRHWLERNIEMIMDIEKCSYKEALPKAQIMLHDFGYRSAMCSQESDSLGSTHLLAFNGTDTFGGAYNAWKNGAPSYIGGSVPALAHRIVQGYVNEGDAYEAIYNSQPNNAIVSMVADCYNYKRAVSKYLIPLALRSKSENNGKIVVARPDSGNPEEMVLWTLQEAEKHGLIETHSNGFKYATYLRVIQGDGMTYNAMRLINQSAIKAGFAPHGCYVYGVGGYLRNSIHRDDVSAKYALCSVGAYKRPVVKLSETEGKGTLPSVKVCRDPELLASGRTIQSNRSEYVDAMEIYYDFNMSTMKLIPFNSFMVVRERSLNQFPKMPKTGGVCSAEVMLEVKSILDQYEC